MLQSFSEVSVSKKVDNHNNCAELTVVFPSSSNKMIPEKYSEDSAFNMTKGSEIKTSNYKSKIIPNSITIISNNMHTSICHDTINVITLKQRVNNWLELKNLIEEIETNPYEANDFRICELKILAYSSIVVESLNDMGAFCEKDKSVCDSHFQQIHEEKFLILHDPSSARISLDKCDESGYTMSHILLFNKLDDCSSEVSDGSELDSIIFKPIEKLPTLQ